MSSFMSQIKTVVVLMLENRSFDNVLGWLYEDDVPARVVPAGSSPSFDGLSGCSHCANSAVGEGGVTWTYRPAHGTAGYLQPMRTPRSDPWEGIAHVEHQMYADASSAIPPAPTRWGDAAPMSGFAADYPAPADFSGEVMGAYSPTDLPVLNGLARSFAVSDAWFSSVPTETDPNRAFSICGTSLGRTGDLPLDPFDVPTMFNGLDEAGVSWGIFWQYRGLLDLDPDLDDRRCWTVDRFPHIGRSLELGFGTVRPYDHFLAALRAGDPLPQVCYVEPYWGWGVGGAEGTDFVGMQGNDYHPPTWVGPAERDLAELYEALVESPQWDDMLVVITFDEHGGTFDHVPPPAAVPPDDHVGTYGDRAFAFDRLGPRVPAILVSPFVEPGTVFRAPTDSPAAFDHTSVIATILRWAGTDPAFIARLGRRVAQAPTFESALTETRRAPSPRFPLPVERPGHEPPKGPHGFDTPLARLTWDDLRAVADELRADGRLTALDVKSEVERRFHR